MTLETYFLLSTSFAATLLCILFLGVIIIGVLVAIKLNTLLKKINSLIETTQSMAGSVKNLVETSTSRLVAFERMFFTMQGIKNVASHIADAFHKRSKKSSSSLTDNE